MYIYGAEIDWDLFELRRVGQHVYSIFGVKIVNVMLNMDLGFIGRSAILVHTPTKLDQTITDLLATHVTLIYHGPFVILLE